MSIEIFIAAFVTDGFIRSIFGDFLVVMLIYSFVKTFIDWKPINVALGVLLFAFSVEFLQYINVLEFLNLQNNHLANLILGNTFQSSDLAAYTLGIIVVLIIEYKIKMF